MHPHRLPQTYPLGGGSQAVGRLAQAAAVMLLLAFGTPPLPAAPSAPFRAGAHKVDITPSRLPIIVSGGFLAAVGERLEGNLFARCVVLDDGAGAAVLAVVDTLMMPRELLDRVKQEASRRTGIPAARMLIAATHTHSAPPVMGALGTDVNPEYAAWVEERLVEAIEGAANRLEPAEVGWAVTEATGLTHCRRWILRPDKMRADPFGEITVRAQMHPGFQNPEFLGPSGPVDSQLSLLAVRARHGRPIALLANYAMHYVGAGPKVVSPDYFGDFSEIFEREVNANHGPSSFVAMMTQGASGDQYWVDYSLPRRPEMTPRRYAEMMAAIARDAWSKIRYQPSAPIRMAETTLRLVRRTSDARRLQWARELVAKMAGAPPRNQPEVYAREQLFLHEEPERELKLQALRLGSLGITAIPNEVFALTGLKIKALSPLEPTINITLANGADGYIPPPEQFPFGGYTTWPARTAGLEPLAEPKITEAVLSLLERVAGKQRREPAATPNSYEKAVRRSQPLAYWRLNEFGGTTAWDATGKGNHARYSGRIAFYLEGAPPASPPGALSRTPQFAGGLMTATVGPRLGRRYTLTMWVFNALPSDARDVTAVLFGEGDQLVLGIGGKTHATGKLFLRTPTGVVEGRSKIDPRQWHHLALVRDGGNVRVYLNAQPAPEIDTTTDVVAGAATLFFAGRPAGRENLEGKLDEIALFPRILPLTELARHTAAAQQ